MLIPFIGRANCALWRIFVKWRFGGGPLGAGKIDKALCTGFEVRWRYDTIEAQVLPLLIEKRIEDLWRCADRGVVVFRLIGGSATRRATVSTTPTLGFSVQDIAINNVNH